MMKEQRILSATSEIVSAVSIAVIGVILFSLKPQLHDFGFPGDPWKRSLQVSGLWVQFVATLMLALELFRGPVAKSELAKYTVRREELTRELHRIQNESDRSKRVEQWLELDARRLKLDLEYQPLFQFKSTVRKVGIAGLLLFGIGLLLSIVSAG